MGARAAALQFPRRASCRPQGGFTIGDARFEMRRFEFSCSRPLAPSYRVSVTNEPVPPPHLTANIMTKIRISKLFLKRVLMYFNVSGASVTNIHPFLLVVAHTDGNQPTKPIPPPRLVTPPPPGIDWPPPLWSHLVLIHF